MFFPHGLGRERGMFSAKTLDFFFFFDRFQVCCFLRDIHAYDNAFFEIKFTLNICVDCGYD